MTGFIVGVLLSLPPILLSLTFHEFAHAWAADRLGDPTAKMMGRLTLNPIPHIDIMGLVLIIIARFGWAKPVPVNPDNFRHPLRDMALVAAAGPASNLLLAVVFALLTKLALPLAATGTAGGFLIQMLFIGVVINLILAAFNLIPLFPLDGWRVLTYFVPSLGQNARLQQFSPLILMGLIFLPRLVGGIDPLGMFLWPLVNAGVLLLLGPGFAV